jgi:hypothetical protein
VAVVIAVAVQVLVRPTVVDTIRLLMADLTEQVVVPLTRAVTTLGRLEVTTTVRTSSD